MKEKKIINWIKNKVKKANKNGVLIGLSGGIDSSVVAVLSKKALNNNMLGLIMPCETNREDILDAKNLARKFKIKYKVINLTPVFKKFKSILPKGNRLSYGNLKARLRMAILYYFANNLNYIVAGTGNRTELALGYFTKYGDGGVDILPIGNLTKSDVRELAKKLNIPEKIIKKPPSAGLWQGQTDEDEIGLTYQELDKIIDNKNLLKKHSKKTKNRIKALMKNARHKLSMPEICK